MKIDRILYQKIFPIGPYLNHKIGVEVQLDETDNIDEAYLKAKSKVEEWSQADLVLGDDIPVVNVRDDVHRDAISDCKTIEELAKLKKGLPPRMMPYYMNKLRYLTNQILVK